MIRNLHLYYKEGTSDKEYHLFQEETPKGWVVRYKHGKRGSKLQEGVKTREPVPEAKATKIFDEIEAEKRGKGYRNMDETGEPTFTPRASKAPYLPMLLQDIPPGPELEKLLDSAHWWMEPKFDGKRVMIEKVGEEVRAYNRTGISIEPPEFMQAALAQVGDVFLDGELVTWGGGVRYFLFDVLSVAGLVAATKPYSERQLLVEAIGKLAGSHQLVPTKVARTPGEKRALLAELKIAGREGVVLKDSNSAYKTGRTYAARKHKFYATATVVVTAQNAKRSVGMGLYVDGALGYDLVFVGDCSIPVNYEVPAVGSLVEIRYLYAFPETKALFQPIYQGERDDVGHDAAVLSQLKYRKAD